MKTAATYRTLRSRYGMMVLIAFAMIFTLSSCDRGRDGRPGRAYLSLAWEVDRPDLIDAGTPDIPAYFEWGRSYRAYSGWYTLYYEGRFWNGFANAFYAWEVDYEIWYEKGDRGGYDYDGRDGRDNYFTLICSPYGPGVDRYTAKSSALSGSPVITTREDGSIEIVYNNGEMGMRAIYRKVEPREATGLTSAAAKE
ncbi:MAG TPA: hypothetical protein PLE85_02430 [Bacteroidales bacterium]|nr:hypothetical protein [Bacteroidales bacterium]